MSRTGRVGAFGRVVLVTGVALGAMPILGANPAYACSCVQTDEQRQYDEATHVFKGTLAQAAPERTGEADQGAGTVTYAFDVLDTYKGVVGDPQKVSTAAESAACGVDLDGTGPFLVFAYEAADPPGAAAAAGDDPPADTPAAAAPVLSMSLCGGTRPIGLNDQPTFGEVPDTMTPAEPAGPATPDAGTPATEAPATEAPATEPPATEPAPAQKQSPVALVITKVKGYLATILGPREASTAAQ